MSVDLLPKVDPVDAESGDHDLFAHYVKKRDLERAIFDGIPCVALCGKVWLPSRDYTKFPVCPECRDTYGHLRA